MRKTGLIAFCAFFSQIFAIDFHDFDCYQGKLTKKQIEIRLQTFLEKDPEIRKFYRTTSEGLFIGDLSRDQCDFYLRFELNTPSKKVKEGKCLQHAKIAIDPGHFGGDYAKLEKRYVYFGPEKTKTNDPVSFNEGALTFLTALVLKNFLEAEGAEVFISRSKIGKGAIKESFFEWLEKNPNLWKQDVQLSELFKKYNKQDLIERAQAINAFSPDLTLIIHYNACFEGGEGKTTQDNYNLVFIPGSFGVNELSAQEDRYEFLRLLLTDDLEESLRLSECVAGHFEKQLNIPLMDKDKAPYLEHVSLPQKPGVYSRNLSLTRRIHGPLCYGETLIQDNEEEIYRLSSCNAFVEGHSCPERVIQVAKAYFEGIKNYFNEN